MKTICQQPLDRVQPGETLGRDVLDAQGNRLLAAGAELSTKTLAQLQRRGIKSVALSQENPLSVEQQETWRRTVEQQLALRFRKVQDHPPMQQLQVLLRDYRLGKTI
ncbi:MAG: hypothetical protein BMS9Abin36_0056 [Gammaproteobacteria bacterium]|nr:MAG: hypothetical protein BMS9Abin36_0056 [Gammaproteobacteria bacterium]